MGLFHRAGQRCAHHPALLRHRRSAGSAQRGVPHPLCGISLQLFIPAATVSGRPGLRCFLLCEKTAPGRRRDRRCTGVCVHPVQPVHRLSPSVLCLAYGVPAPVAAGCGADLGRQAAISVYLHCFFGRCQQFLLFLYAGDHHGVVHAVSADLPFPAPGQSCGGQVLSNHRLCLAGRRAQCRGTAAGGAGLYG